MYTYLYIEMRWDTILHPYYFLKCSWRMGHNMIWQWQTKLLACQLKVKKLFSPTSGWPYFDPCTIRLFFVSTFWPYLKDIPKTIAGKLIVSLPMCVSWNCQVGVAKRKWHWFSLCPASEWRWFVRCQSVSMSACSDFLWMCFNTKHTEICSEIRESTPGDTLILVKLPFQHAPGLLEIHHGGGCNCIGRALAGASIIRVVLQVQVHQISICTLHTLFGNIIVMESQISSNFLFFSRDLTLFIRGLFFFRQNSPVFFSQAAPLQFLAPYTGCAMAEYFRDNGKHAARAAQ